MSKSGIYCSLDGSPFLLPLETRVLYHPNKNLLLTYAPIAQCTHNPLVGFNLRKVTVFQLDFGPTCFVSYKHKKNCGRGKQFLDCVVLILLKGIRVSSISWRITFVVSYLLLFHTITLWLRRPLLAQSLAHH